MLYLLYASGSLVRVQVRGGAALSLGGLLFRLTDLPHEASPEASLACPLANLKDPHCLLHTHGLKGDLLSRSTAAIQGSRFIITDGTTEWAEVNRLVFDV